VETISLLYSRTGFVLGDPGALLWFASFVSPQGLSAIRSLKLTWDWALPLRKDMNPKHPLAKHDEPGKWELMKRQCGGMKRINSPITIDKIWLRFWETIAYEMPGLRKLHLDLGDTLLDQVTGLELHIPWVQPILQVRGLQEFRFTLFSKRDTIVGGLRMINVKCQPTSKRLEEASRFEERIREIVVRPKVDNGNSVKIYI